MFNFLLETANNPWMQWGSIALIVVLIVVFYFFMIRPQKKQEKKDAEMRNQLQVGDEVTTIGGIIGKVVSIKDETFVLETSKDRTKIRFLKGAIKTVDVRIADIAAQQAAEAAQEANGEAATEAVAEEKPAKKGFFARFKKDKKDKKDETK